MHAHTRGNVEKIVPDRPFHKLRASKSVDRLTLFCTELSIDGLWSFKMTKGSVGYLRNQASNKPVIPVEPTLHDCYPNTKIAYICPTEPFSMQETKNMLADISELRKICRSTKI